MSEKAYSLLVDLDSLSKKNAAELPAIQELRSTWSGIGFRMGETRYVAPIDEVSEVIDVPSFTVVPGVKSWVKGLANVRGRLLPIMDLSFFLQAVRKERESSRRIIVVDKEDMYSGLLVDEVFGMQHFDVESFKDEGESCGELIDPFVEGAYQKEEQEWHVFKLFELADDPQFLHASVSNSSV
jgi:twitching motility protein PilI